MLLLRKPNRLSVLKNRPEEFQQEVINYLDGTATAPRHSLKETAEWLKSKGIETSLSSLCDFRRWREEAQQRAALAASYLQRVSERIADPSLTQEQILQIGQAFFEECAVNDPDAKLFTRMFRLRQMERAQELRHFALRIRNDVAQHRAEMQERTLACRERMTNLAIWKASLKTEPKTKAANASPHPSYDQSRGASSTPGRAAAPRVPSHPVSGKAAGAVRPTETANEPFAEIDKLDMNRTEALAA